MTKQKEQTYLIVRSKDKIVVDIPIGNETTIADFEMVMEYFESIYKDMTIEYKIK